MIHSRNTPWDTSYLLSITYKVAISSSAEFKLHYKAIYRVSNSWHDTSLGLTKHHVLLQSIFKSVKNLQQGIFYGTLMHEYHEEVMTWKHFLHYLGFVRRFYQQGSALRVSSMLSWTSYWTNSKVASSLTCHNAHVISLQWFWAWFSISITSDGWSWNTHVFKMGIPIIKWVYVFLVACWFIFTQRQHFVSCLFHTKP